MQNIWKFIVQKASLQEMANFQWLFGRCHTLIWRPGDMVQNLESSRLSGRVDGTVWGPNKRSSGPLRPVSNVMLLPCWTQYYSLNSIWLKHGTMKHMQLPCWTQFINDKYIWINLQSSLNCILFFSFVFRNIVLLYSTELNSMSETRSFYSSVRVVLKLRQLRPAVAQCLKQA